MVQMNDEEIKEWQSLLSADWPEIEIYILNNTDSTNNWLHKRRESLKGKDVIALTDFQTAGRGSGSNHWESETGKNLIFSLQVCPNALLPNRVFFLSEVMSLAVCMGLEQYVQYVGKSKDNKRFRIKWPNDIYYADGKVCGMLIENNIQSRRVDNSVMGVGINVNQTVFLSDAPNPLSLALILGMNSSRLSVLRYVLACFRDCYAMLEQEQYETLHALYLSKIYRFGEWHNYKDSEGILEGAITNIKPDGHLIIRDRDGKERAYAFGEIKYMI